MIRPLVAVCCLMVVGCVGNAGRSADAIGEAQPFVETVPGSTVKVTLRPVGTGAGVVWFSETETTWDAYDAFYLRLDEQGSIANAGQEGPDAITRPTQPYSPPDRGWGHGGYPAIGVTFHAAKKYCEWLSAKTGRTYRLPTTLEFEAGLWESCGTSLAPSLEMYWFAENAGETTHPVASKAANRRGLHDMAGNVAEWCIDADGQPVVCGGSFNDLLSEWPHDRTNSSRQIREWNATDPSFPKSKWWLRDAPFVGFRVVCEEGPR
jgi:hypothetical protein